jgi:hypothetical protein
MATSRRRRARRAPTAADIIGFDEVACTACGVAFEVDGEFL